MHDDEEPCGSVALMRGHSPQRGFGIVSDSGIWTRNILLSSLTASLRILPWLYWNDCMALCCLSLYCVVLTVSLLWINQFSGIAHVKISMIVNDECGWGMSVVHLRHAWVSAWATLFGGLRPKHHSETCMIVFLNFCDFLSWSLNYNIVELNFGCDYTWAPLYLNMDGLRSLLVIHRDSDSNLASW